MGSYTKNDTNFLRALAIILIVNSHLKNFYPVQQLATGGMIGNALFFVLSSLGLYLSWQTKKQKDFQSWYSQRIRRIYPSVWVTIILITLPIAIYSGTLTAESFFFEMGMFFFPPFWFLQALMIYYFLYFFILNRFSYKLLIAVSVPTILLYTVYYCFYLDLNAFSIETNPLRQIFYFLIFLWGGYLGTVKERIRFAGIFDVFMVILCFSCIYAHKFLMFKSILSSLQFIQHLAVFPLLFYMLKVANSNFIVATVMQNPFWSRIFNYLSKMTLEIFIVNNSIDKIFEQLNLSFPMGAILYVVTTLIIATLVHSLSNYVRNIFKLSC